MPISNTTPSARPPGIIRVADIIAQLTVMHTIGKISQVFHFTPDAILHSEHQLLFVVGRRAPLLECLRRADMAGNPLAEKKSYTASSDHKPAGAPQLVLSSLNLSTHFV